MPSPSVRILLLASLAVAMLLWLDLLPAEVLGQAARLALGWSILSTVIVAGAGAWVAFRRAAAERAAGLARPRWAGRGRA
jgi:hypothetical protein